RHAGPRARVGHLRGRRAPRALRLRAGALDQRARPLVGTAELREQFRDEHPPPRLAHRRGESAQQSSRLPVEPEVQRAALGVRPLVDGDQGLDGGAARDPCGRQGQADVGTLSSPGWLGPERALSIARLAAALCCLSLAALVIGAVPGEGALLSGLKLVSAALTVGLVPGVLCLLASGLAARLSLLETAALGIALSLAIAQACTMVVLLLHVPVAGAAMVLAACCVGGGLLVIWRAWREPGGVTVGRGELALGGSMLLLAALLYVRGSPVMSGEDRIHAGVIRRL